MHSGLRDGPGLIGFLWDRQGSLVSRALESADLAQLTDDLSPAASPDDLLTAIPRALCRHLRFRRGRLWSACDADLCLLASWPADLPDRRPSRSDRKALRGEAALAPGPAPKSLSIPLRAWSGDVSGVVHLKSPLLDRVLTGRDLARAQRYGDAVSGAFRRAELTRMLDETKRLLESRTVAVRESHHRIKNNLQAVAGLLAATGVRAHSPRVRDALGESAARVKAIAAVHEALLADGGGETDLRPLVRTLIRSAFLPLVGPGARIRIRADVCACRVPARSASSLALVVNELATNAVRHAFPHDRGEITIGLRCGRECVLTVADDGGTLPAGPLDESRFGLGLNIVNSIVCNDLGGRFEITGGPRTVAAARFPSFAMPAGPAS